MDRTKSRGTSRRDALRTMSGLAATGIVAVALPSTQAAASGGTGGAGDPPSGRGWSLSSFAVAGTGPSQTFYQVQVDWDGSGRTGISDAWFVRFFVDDGKDLVFVATAPGGSWNSANSQMTFVGVDTVFEGGQFAARLYVDWDVAYPTIEDVPDDAHLVEVNAFFIGPPEPS